MVREISGVRKHAAGYDKRKRRQKTGQLPQHISPFAQSRQFMPLSRESIAHI
jgi:hypothetical protein